MDRKIYTSTLALFVLAALAFAQSAPTLDLIVTAPKQVASNEAELSFILSNPFPEREGVLLLVFNPNRLELKNAGAKCEQTQPRRCTLAVDVATSQEMKIRMGLKDYFEQETVDVLYVMTSRNASVGRRLFLSNTAEPGALKASEVTYAGILLVILGVILWAVTRLRASHPVVMQHFLVLAVFANLLIAAGAMLIAIPSLSALSGLIFALIFFAGFLLLFYLHHNEPSKPITRVDLARQRARLQDELNVAKARFLRREMDDETYRKITGELELEQVKLETTERLLRKKANS